MLKWTWKISVVVVVTQKGADDSVVELNGQLKTVTAFFGSTGYMRHENITAILESFIYGGDISKYMIPGRSFMVCLPY